MKIGELIYSVHPLASMDLEEFLWRNRVSKREDKESAALDIIRGLEFLQNLLIFHGDFRVIYTLLDIRKIFF